MPNRVETFRTENKQIKGVTLNVQNIAEVIGEYHSQFSKRGKEIKLNFGN